MTVAALYVDPKGVYANLPDVEVWDEARDARLYAGPWPVVAHPPCARWCIMAPLVESRYGYVLGDDGGCFEHALWAVRTFGGVLEHPALTFAWSRFGLPAPVCYGWASSFTDPGYATEVSQVAYGHPARKRTWLYYVGDDPPALDWREPSARTVVSDLGSTRNGKTWDEWDGSVQYEEASRTPAAFRDVLLSMARSARPLDVKAPDDIASTS